ncbi:hypothetical protein ABIC89_002508 [Variovorax boronicumulans]|uniref:hypothetical protein n=1 Tax=Variovorax boronicumulans TaxID=436515 RepID=UPI0033931372
MHTQEFSSDWPAVLDDMLEFISLTQLSLGQGRAIRVKVSLSRERVSADALQPHVGDFRIRLLRQLPSVRLELAAGHHSAHRVEVHFGS